MSTLKAIADFFNPKRHYRREVACFLDGEMNVLSLSSSNCGVEVEFDWFSIWDKIKSLKKYPSQVFMIHSHPPGFNRMSHTDRNMVNGWVAALGIPIWYVIFVDGEYCHYLCQRIDKKLVVDYLGNSYGAFGLGEYQGEILKMVIGGLSNSERGFEDKVELDSIAAEINSIFVHEKAESLNLKSDIPDETPDFYACEAEKRRKSFGHSLFV